MRSPQQNLRSLHFHFDQFQIGRQLSEGVFRGFTVGMMKNTGVNEQLKADDPMWWIQEMNALKAQAEEVVLREIVFG